MKDDLLQWGLRGTSALCLSVAMVSPALAAGLPFGDGGAALQTVFNNITSPYPGTSSVNVTTDALSDANDSYWAIGGTGGSVSTIVIELAGFANSNTFGLYDRSDSSKTVQLFSGTQSAGAQALVSILADGSVIVNFADTGKDFASNQFGFYLNTPNGIFYSDTSLNGDGFDHMGAYQGEGDTIKLPGFSPGTWGSNEYALAWEDLNGGGDKDYDDFVVMVESVNPVPEPSTMMLLGTSLLGLAAWNRRKAG